MADRVLTFIFPGRVLATDCVAELKDKMPTGWAFCEAASHQPKNPNLTQGKYLYAHNAVSLSGPENDVAEGDIAAIAGRYSGRLEHV